MSATGDLQKIRLELLAQSQFRLQLARNEDWTELKAFSDNWDNQLSSALSQYRSGLDAVIPQLQKDNDELIKIISETQSKLHDEHIDFKRNMSHAKQYLK